MHILRWALFVILTACINLLQGQARIGFTLDSFPTHVVYGDSSVHFTTGYLHNYGDSAFSDIASLSYMVNDSLYDGTVAGHGLYMTPSPFSIVPGDSSNIQITISPDFHAYQVIGSSGVVIWPISNSASTYDSSFYTVFVTLVADVEPVPDKKLRVYINEQQLFVKTDEQNLLKRVRIFDTQGRLIVDDELTSSGAIPLGRYAGGVYWVEVLLNDNSRRVFKCINLATH